VSQSVSIYDTTLRDGCQGEGIALSLQDKLRIAQRLDELGIHYIEGGWPNPTNPKDVAFFRHISALGLKRAKVSAFGSTRRGGNRPEADPILKTLLGAETDVVAIFGKSWDLHAEEILRVSLDENLEMIRSSVAYLADHGREVVYDAEHFFDGYKHNPTYALATLRAAQDGGAAWVVLCDTNGGTLPHEVERAILEVREQITVPWGIHTHNDSGCAVANAVLAVHHGARQVQGTINGYGERCGNANLCAVIPNLVLKQGIAALAPEALTHLSGLSRFVSEMVMEAPDGRQPYVGSSAFAHKGGAHIDAVRKKTVSFEHVAPELVGNERRILVSEQSGTATIIEKLHTAYPHLDKRDPAVGRLLERLKHLEYEGYEFEAAEGSFHLLAEQTLRPREPFFVLENYRVLDGRHAAGDTYTEATIRVRVGDQVRHTASEGTGPVDALARALREALAPFYPELEQVRLTDYKVRVLNGEAGASARVRVLIQTTDGHESWGTVGVSEDILAASWQALVDSLTFGLRRARARGAASGGEPA